MTRAGRPSFYPPTPFYMKYLAEHINMLTGSDIGYMTFCFIVYCILF